MGSAAMGSVADLQFAEDAGVAQAEVSWQLPQAASEDVQVPEDLSGRQRGGGGLVKRPAATCDIINDDAASGVTGMRSGRSPLTRNTRPAAVIIFNQLISGHTLSHGCQW